MNSEILEQMKQYFDEKLEAFSVVARESGAKKSVSLKSKGNQAQYDHQLDILNRIERAQELIVAGKKDLAIEALKCANEKVSKRMKLIRIADRSELGWSTVDEYMSDEMADDSADERRISKAEAKADAKRKKSFTQKKVAKTPRYEAPPRTQFFRARRGNSSRGSCNGCGKLGHWRYACPEFSRRGESTTGAYPREEQAHGHDQ